MPELPSGPSYLVAPQHLMPTADGCGPTTEVHVIHQQLHSDWSGTNSSQYTTCTNKWFINHHQDKIDKIGTVICELCKNSTRILSKRFPLLTLGQRPVQKDLAQTLLLQGTATGNVMGRLGQFQPERILHFLAKLDLYMYNNRIRSKTKKSFLWTDFFVVTRNFSLNWQKASSQSTSPGCHKVPTPPCHQRCLFWYCWYLIPWNQNPGPLTEHLSAKRSQLHWTSPTLVTAKTSKSKWKPDKTNGYSPEN